MNIPPKRTLKDVATIIQLISVPAPKKHNGSWPKNERTKCQKLNYIEHERIRVREKKFRMDDATGWILPSASSAELRHALITLKLSSEGTKPVLQARLLLYSIGWDASADELSKWFTIAKPLLLDECERLFGEHPHRNMKVPELQMRLLQGMKRKKPYYYCAWKTCCI